MRISTYYGNTQSVDTIDTSYEKYVKLGNEVSSGKRLQNPSDDPAGQTSVLNMSSAKTMLTQYNANIDRAKTDLNSADSALSDIYSIANKAYTMALADSNSDVSQTTRNSDANTLQNYMNQLVSLGNTVGSQGQYLFAGQKTNAKPYTVTAGALTYNGDTNDTQVSAGPNQKVTTTVQASAIISSLYSAMQAMKNHLQTGDVTSLSTTDVSSTTSLRDQITSLRSDVGSRVQMCTTLSDINTRRSDAITAAVSKIQDADTTQVITDYQAAQTTYQAALQVAGQGYKLSLLNYLT